MEPGATSKELITYGHLDNLLNMVSDLPNVTSKVIKLEETLYCMDPAATMPLYSVLEQVDVHSHPSDHTCTDLYPVKYNLDYMPWCRKYGVLESVILNGKAPPSISSICNGVVAELVWYFKFHSQSAEPMSDFHSTLQRILRVTIACPIKTLYVKAMRVLDKMNKARKNNPDGMPYATYIFSAPGAETADPKGRPTQSPRKHGKVAEAKKRPMESSGKCEILVRK